MNSTGLPSINVEQDGQGKTVVPGHAENDISVSYHTKFRATNIFFFFFKVIDYVA